MKVVILAGRLGTRLSEETQLIPKPMVEIGGKPIRWHIMKTYPHYGFNDFMILTGYKSHVKDFFVNHYQRYSDLTVDLATNAVEIHGDGPLFERTPLEALAAEGQFNAFQHHGSWQPMDMLRDKIALTKLWLPDQAPGAVWEKN